MSGFVGKALRGFGKALKGDKTIKGVRPTLGSEEAEAAVRARRTLN